MAFLKFSSLLNDPYDEKKILFSNISYKDMQIESRQSLIDTEGIINHSEVVFEFSNLTFSNIKYTTEGKLLHLEHDMHEEMVFRD